MCWGQCVQGQIKLERVGFKNFINFITWKMENKKYHTWDELNPNCIPISEQNSYSKAVMFDTWLYTLTIEPILMRISKCINKNVSQSKN